MGAGGCATSSHFDHSPLGLKRSSPIAAGVPMESVSGNIDWVKGAARDQVAFAESARTFV
eukprot:5994468-Prorocentrum_lima.AAC.1